MDFVDVKEGQSIHDKTFICGEYLQTYTNLYVIKSISKSYGVPGIRLGVLASGDAKMIREIKQDVSIWNINSFGEFYMQIMEKYSGQYETALQEFRQCRLDFMQKLREIPFLDVCKTQANYVMCQVKDRESRALCCQLLRYNMLIKDISEKIGNGKQYVRIAIRTQEENEKLIQVLKEL